MSIQIFAIRHAATAWNQEKRLQGRQDIPLSPVGIESLAEKSIPAPYRSWHWYCSPLLRAVQTASALGVESYQPEPQLIEMDWGDWEGQRLPELRATLGEAMQLAEAKGLDLQPPNGESPRLVQQRLLDWLRQLPDGEDVGIVCHKGVLRALLSSALEWGMLDDCPIKVDWSMALLFRWEASDGLTLVDYNIPLRP